MTGVSLAALLKRIRRRGAAVTIHNHADIFLRGRVTSAEEKQLAANARAVVDILISEEPDGRIRASLEYHAARRRANAQLPQLDDEDGEDDSW